MEAASRKHGFSGVDETAASERLLFIAQRGPRASLGIAISISNNDGYVKGQLRVATVKALVGAFVDAAGLLVAGVALAEGDEVPDETAVAVLRQLEHKAEGSLRGSLPPKRHVQLDATQKSRPSSLSVSHFCQSRFAAPASTSRRARSAWMRAGERLSRRSTSSTTPRGRT